MRRLLICMILCISLLIPGCSRESPVLDESPQGVVPLNTNPQQGSSTNEANSPKQPIYNDGAIEDIVVAQTPRKDNGYPDLKPEDRFKDGAGVYISALVMKNNEVFPLFYEGYRLKDLTYMDDKYLPFGIDSCLGLRVQGVYDLNNDGRFELCLANYGWESTEYRVFELQGEKEIKEVLYGDYGM